MVSLHRQRTSRRQRASHLHRLVNSDVYGSRILIATPTSLSHVRAILGAGDNRISVYGAKTEVAKSAMIASLERACFVLSFDANNSNFFVFAWKCTYSQSRSHIHMYVSSCLLESSYIQYLHPPYISEPLILPP